MSNLGSAPAVWRGQSLPSGITPERGIAQEILNELFEVNFRYDLLMLDRACYRLAPKNFEISQSSTEPGEIVYDDLDASSYGDRQLRVLAAIPHFESGLIPADSDDGQCGFASPDARVRREAYVGLYRIMKSWNGHDIPPLSPRTAAAAEQLSGPGSVSIEDLIAAEDGLSWHFVNSYYTVIGRTPLLPHGLS